MATRIVFDHVWKKFRKGERHDSLRDLIPSVVTRLTKGKPEGLAAEEFWAVEDVSFEVGDGEALGIIGPNGAGKSTTLKLLTRIFRPTRGRCHVTGRVGALVEVAAGFHPDLTGRENVFLQGSIMGMSRVEISKHFDEIVDFAGISEFIDTPVKRYSSGMNARLGFSIAAHLEPDVLIIDEVLSVGDMVFQQRCVERMFEFKRRGVAIVFVSHQLKSVADLCDHVLVLKRSTQFLGSAAEGINRYVQEMGQESRANSHGVVIQADLCDATTGQPLSAVRPGALLRARIQYRAEQAIDEFLVAFIVRRTTDQLVAYDGHFAGEELGHDGLASGETLTVQFDFTANLTRGQYHLETHFFELKSQRYLGWLSPAGIITIDERRTWSGVADLTVRATPVEAALDRPSA